MAVYNNINSVYKYSNCTSGISVAFSFGIN